MITSLLISRLLLSALVLLICGFGLHRIWTKRVDILGVITKPLEKVIPVKDDPKPVDPAPPAAAPVAAPAPIVNITSNNQQGGITAQNVTVNQAPEPTVDIRPGRENNVPDGGLFRSQFEIVVVAHSVIANLRLEVGTPGIVRFEVGANRTGMLQTGHSGVRPNLAFTSIVNASSGVYTGTIWTTAPLAAPVDVRYDW